MSADRFQFLEFGEAADGDAARADVPGPIPREIGLERLADGTALAEVRIENAHGYALPDDEDEGIETLSSRAARNGSAPDGGVPTRLRPAEVLGERGDGAGQFHYPTGLAVDGGGVLFICDSYGHRLQRITPGGGVAVIGGRGTGRGQFLSPSGVAIDDEDAFYVVERGGQRVQKFSHEGVLSLVFGRPGRGEGELSGPTAIAVAPGGGIFVADTGNSRVQRFDGEGRFVGAVGGLGLIGGGLGSPQALAVQPGGGLYVAETSAHRVTVFDPLGRPERQIGGGLGAGRRSLGSAPPLSLLQPRALALDPAGLLYVADAGEPDAITGETRGRVQCLSLADGRVLATLERLGRSLGTLLRPGGLAVGPAPAANGHGAARRDLYVADTMNHRILRFVWT